MPRKKTILKEEHIVLDGKEVRYTLKVHSRSRSIKLAAYAGEGFVVTIPRWVSREMVGRFLIAQKQWILAQVKMGNASRRHLATKGTYKDMREEALRIIEACVDAQNAHYKLDLAGVFVRNQKTRWGSCSERKNLTFSYQTAYLPARLRDYVIVHELCHLLEFNHSRAFWSWVAETIPDYKVRKKELGVYTPR